MSYVRPRTLQEALAALSGNALAVLAGGTDFYPARVGRSIDDDILDISAIAGLRGITEHDDHFRIGALTTWREVVEAPLPPWFDGLKAAAREVGGVQIQNAGTVGGNICNASPAADGVPPLLAMDAEVELGSIRGTHSMRLSNFIIGNRETRRARDEIATALRIPKPRHPARAAFLKLGARRYLVISIAMVAAVIERDECGAIAAARIAVGSCSAVARRLHLLERELVGRPLETGLGSAVEARHLAMLSPIDDVRGSADYRRDAAVTLVRRALDGLGRTA